MTIDDDVQEEYDERFSKEDKEFFKRFNISPAAANSYLKRYGKYITAEEIKAFSKAGITAEHLEEINRHFESSFGHESSVLVELLYYGSVKDYKLLFVGKKSIILADNETVRKFLPSVDLVVEEADQLLKINEYHKRKQSNVAVFEEGSIDRYSFMIQFIKGDTLENILRKQPSLPPEKVLKYGAGIMNGLIEMRQAGIWYHRDIRPANIMIDKERDEPVIVDFGIATTDKHALPQDNRRFGGANDLVSLGQVMYKMATGEHIFAGSKSMELSIYAENLRDYRDEVYADPTGKLLQKHLQQVDETVQDETVATLIKSCLTARRGHYRKMQRMFERYAA